MSLAIQSTSEAPVNIFRELRQASQLSHADLARISGISKRSLIWLEQGIYEFPLPRAVEFWLEEGRFLPGIKTSGIRLTELTLTEGYELFKEETRALRRGYFGDSIHYVSFNVVCKHPCLQMMDGAQRAGNDATINGIAKALCIPQSSLNQWVRNWRTVQSVPKTFQKALLDIGYTRYEVRRLVEGYPKWREINK